MKDAIAGRSIVLLSISLAALTSVHAGSSPPLHLPLESEKLTAPEGVTLPSFDAVEITPLGKGRYDVKLSPGENPPRLPALDLSFSRRGFRGLRQATRA